MRRLPLTLLTVAALAAGVPAAQASGAAAAQGCAQSVYDAGQVVGQAWDGSQDAVYGGITFSEGTCTFTVHVTQDTPDQRTRLLKGQDPADFAWVVVAHSYATLRDVMDRITADEPDLAAQGIQLNGWGPDIDASKVRIGVRDLTDAGKAYLEQRYGADLVYAVEDDSMVYATSGVGHAPQRLALPTFTSTRTHPFASRTGVLGGSSRCLWITTADRKRVHLDWPKGWTVSQRSSWAVRNARGKVLAHKGDVITVTVAPVVRNVGQRCGRQLLGVTRLKR